jgi:hypothetical protein
VQLDTGRRVGHRKGRRRPPFYHFGQVHLGCAAGRGDEGERGPAGVNVRGEGFVGCFF